MPPPDPADPLDPPALRRLALAAAVLDDVDLEPARGGVVLRGGRPVTVGWAELGAAAGAGPLEGARARRRVVRHLRGRRLLADRSPDALAARPVGYPVDHPDHPGPAWVREPVLGGALDLGLGLRVGEGDVAVVPAECFAAAGVDPAPWWPAARDYLERMGGLAAVHLRRQARALLRPFGDCDVVTLLGSRVLRTAVCAGAGAGLRAAAVPMRTRGWLDLARIDPAFAVAAAAATDEPERGFSRALLLTADEVVLAAGDGRPAAEVFRDPAARDPADPAFRWP